jgi:hypothetical protein
LICAIFFSRFTFYARHGKLSSADQLKNRIIASGTQKNLIPNLEREIAFVTTGHYGNALNFQNSSRCNRIAAYQLKAEIERLRDYRRKFPYLKPYCLYPLKLMRSSFFNDDFEEAFGN